MSRLEELEKAVEQLSAGDLAKFAAWFDERRAEQWDRQIKRDVEEGKLDKLAEKWRADYAAGKFTEL